MRAVERLEAAVTQLEKLRAASEPVRDDSSWGVDYDVSEDVRRVLVLDSHDGGHDGTIVAEATSVARAQLIVALYRTVDAQLAILRHAAADPVSRDEPGALQDALVLADAILGDASWTTGFDFVDKQLRHAEQVTARATALAHVLLEQTLAPSDRCTAVGWPTQTQAVMCELDTHGPDTYHRAHFMGTGVVEWRDTTYIHPHEVTTAAVDPDEQHDIAKESTEDPL